VKIGIVLYPTFGGSGVVATELGLELASRGHEVHFISYNQPARINFFNRNVTFHEVIVPDYPLFEFAPYETALTGKIVDVALFEDLDILHAHYAIPHATCAYLAKQILAAKGKHLPFITTLHGTDITLVGKEPSYLPSVTFAIENSDAVTAVSGSLRDHTIKEFGIKNPIHVIHNFINPDLFRYSPEKCIRRYTAPNGEKIIMHISNFRPVKRIPDVIKVFAGIRSKLPVKLVMVGDGPERTLAERMVRDLGLTADVHFYGKIKHTSDILPCSDLFILPSESESFGLSGLEALASGVPVISTNTGGTPEVQIHGETGFLASPGDVEAMVNYGIDLLGNEDRLKKFKANAKRRAMEFTADKIIPKYEALYRAVLENKNPAS
jgi:N-acetyl-alpha-D-glucosaminyl L-malate synthase BshA